MSEATEKAGGRMADRRMAASEFLHIAMRALNTSYKARGRASTVVSALGFALALLPMLVSVALRGFTDSVQALFEGRADLTFALLLFLGLTGLYIAQLLHSVIRSYYASADTERIMHYLRESILRCTCSVKMKYIENYDDFSERITFVDTYAGEEVARSMQEVAAWLQNLITFVALSVVLAGINPWIVLVIVLTCAPSIFLTHRQEEEKYMQNKKWGRTSAFIQQYFQDCTRFASLQEMRFERIFPYVKERKWRRSVDEFVKADNALKRRHTIVNCAADLFSGSVYLFILVIVAYEIYQDPAIGLGAFMLVVSVAGQMQGLAAQLFFGATQFASNVRYMKDFFYLEDLEYEERQRASSALDDVEICFRGVSFTYPSSDSPVLRDIDVTIHEGEKVAIVGRNGSGKSTFVNLLCALYEPQQGSVTVGGVEASGNLSRVREDISVVFQDFGRYEDTIRFNVAISDQERECDDDELMALCERTGAADFIRERPGGLDEVVGSFSEHGNNLSGGQWQRLAITRAAYRDNARIMLLDEPTSALDPIAEANLYRNFAQLAGDRTTLLISHRLGITSIVDRVLVFDEGRIVEDGSHAELMKKGGLYAELYQSQAQWYQ